MRLNMVVPAAHDIQALRKLLPLRAAQADRMRLRLVSVLEDQSTNLKQTFQLDRYTQLIPANLKSTNLVLLSCSSVWETGR